MENRTFPGFTILAAVEERAAVAEEPGQQHPLWQTAREAGYQQSGSETRSGSIQSGSQR